MEKYDDYDVLDFGTSLIPGAQIKIEHSVSSEKADLSDLISRSAEDLQALREESAASEQKAYFGRCSPMGKTSGFYPAH